MTKPIPGPRLPIAMSRHLFTAGVCVTSALACAVTALRYSAVRRRRRLCLPTPYRQPSHVRVLPHG